MGEAKVGDPDPLAAIQDECNFNTYDELIVSDPAAEHFEVAACRPTA